MENSNIFRLNIRDLAGAVVSAVLVAILVYLAGVTSLFAVDVYKLIDIAFFAMVGSLLKSFTTDSTGYFLGTMKVK